MVYVLTIAAALVVATGEVIQQRTASQAPPQYNLSVRLLLWLVRRPRWLAGVACSAGGNILFATALARGSVALVEAVFVVRLLFGLGLAAAWGRHRLPGRDLLGAFAITVGLVVFIFGAQPSEATSDVPNLSWAIGGGSVVVFAVVLAVIARRSPPARKAVLLGAGAGALFGLQASLTQSAVRVLTDQGVVALLTTWNGYAVALVALLGMLLVQSAFEAAPLTASYPAVVTVQLIAGIAVGVGVVGGTLLLGPLGVVSLVVSMAAMIGGIYLLTTSPLVTGQLDELIRQQDVGEAAQVEQRLERELRRAERLAERPAGARDERKLRRDLDRIGAGIDQLCQVQDEMRRHREGEQERMVELPESQRRDAAESHRMLEERERTVNEQAQRLREHAERLTATLSAGRRSGGE